MKILILFDIDGTLLYSDKVDSRCFAASYGSIFGQPFPTIDWSRFPAVTDHVIFRTAFHAHFGRYPTAEERDRFEEHYLGALTQVRGKDPGISREVPGAVALWHRLAEDPNYTIGIATGGWQRPAAIKLAHVGIPPNPPYAAYANDMHRREDILQRAITLAQAEHPIHRVVYVGDALWDLTTTRAMNIPFLGVRLAGDHATLQRHGARRVITNYQDQSAFFAHIHALLEED